MRTLTVLRSEWKANVANFNISDESFPCFTTIGPKPIYTWDGPNRIEQRSPPSPKDIAVLRSFASALPDLEEGATESSGWQFVEPPWNRTGDYRSVLAQLRGERSEGPFDFWEHGRKVRRYSNRNLAVDLDYVLDDDEERIHPCANEFNWRLEPALGAILNKLPRSHRHHRSFSMKPHSANPLADKTQAGLITKLPWNSSNLRGWVMTGPPGTSKTTYAAAALVDMWTLAAHEGSDLRLYRVEVPEWLAEMAAWDTRDFASDSEIPEPEISVREIRNCGGSPVLWLEELDKFNPTNTRLNYLYRLVNMVYEMKGLIIVTCNDTETQLRERLGPAISRRIFGDNDDQSVFEHWQLVTAGTGKGNQKAKSR